MINYKLPWSYTKTHSNNPEQQSLCILRDCKGDILGIIPNWVIAEHIITLANDEHNRILEQHK